MRALWPWGARCHWDQGLLTEAFEGRLWPGVRAEEHLETHPEHPDEPRPPLPTDEGAVVVASLSLLRAWGDGPVRDLLARLPWALFVGTSDETSSYDASPLRRLGRVATWVQTPRPNRRHGGDRTFLLGWQADTRAFLAGCPLLALADRPLRWAFGGQVANQRRRDCLAALQGLRGIPHDLLTTDGFALGRPRAEHLAVLSQAAVAVCPPGHHTPDTFRLYEALEAGCLPICDRYSPTWLGRDGGYWQLVLGDEPFPCVDDWSELPALLGRILGDPVAAQAAANRAAAWWAGYKRQLAINLVTDASQLAGERAPRGRVTVLIPTSPIPAHPSTEFVEECIWRIRTYPTLADAEIILMVDGLHSQHADRAAAYAEYTRRLIERCSWDPEWRGVLPLVFDEWTHQAGMARRALELVRTPLVLYVEHDTWPTGEIDWAGIFGALEQPGVNVVRLHIFDEVLEEHRHLYADHAVDVASVPLVQTRAWSQRPHVARTSWYRQMLARCFTDASRTMIEDPLYGLMLASSPERWGVWIYAPPGGMRRSAHRDGRRGEAKLPMVFR